MWRNFVDDLLHAPGAQRDRYPYEARLRVMLHLLAEENRAIPPGELAHLEEVDLRLKTRWQPGGFIWPAEIEAGFPTETYWYLYGQPNIH